MMWTFVLTKFSENKAINVVSKIFTSIEGNLTWLPVFFYTSFEPGSDIIGTDKV